MEGGKVPERGVWGALGAVWGGQLVWHVPQPKCSGTIQRLGKVLQRSEDVSNDVQGVGRGSGEVWGIWSSLGGVG